MDDTPVDSIDLFFNQFDENKYSILPQAYQFVLCCILSLFSKSFFEVIVLVLCEKITLLIDGKKKYGHNFQKVHHFKLIIFKHFIHKMFFKTLS